MPSFYNRITECLILQLMLSQAIYLYYNIIIIQSGEPLSKKARTICF